MEELNPDPRTDEDGGFIVACAAALQEHGGCRGGRGGGGASWHLCWVKCVQVGDTPKIKLHPFQWWRSRATNLSLVDF